MQFESNALSKRSLIGMRKIFFSAAGALLAAPAFAGGYSYSPAPEPVVAAPVAQAAPSWDWTGAYVGLQYDKIFDGTYTAGGTDSDVNGQVYGVFGGYRHDFGRFVLGGELDYMVGEGSIDAPAQIGGKFDVDVDHLVRLGLEGGYDFGRFLLYGTVGYADIKITDDTNSSVSSNGYFYGVGADYLVSDNFVVGAELLQHKFDDFGGVASGDELDLLTFGINISYKF